MNLKNKLGKISEHRYFIRALPIVFLVLLIIFFSIMTKGRFATLTSLKIIFEQALIVGIVSTGACFIFATGNTNLAMGATTVLAATLAGKAYGATNSPLVMIGVALITGVGIMVISALLSTLLNIRVLFVTIVMMTLLTALQQTILGGTTVSIPTELIGKFRDMKFTYIAFALYLLVSIILFHFTAIGRAQRMIGTNEVCSEQTGISRNKYLLLAFIIAGVGCGLGAMLAIIRAGSIGERTLPSLNMDCMLALVLGGMSIFGGSRSFAYAGVVGALTVCVLNQGLLMINVDSTIIQGIRGIIFLILVCTSQKRPQGLPAPEG